MSPSSCKIYLYFSDPLSNLQRQNIQNFTHDVNIVLFRIVCNEFKYAGYLFAKWLCFFMFHFPILAIVIFFNIVCTRHYNCCIFMSSYRFCFLQQACYCRFCYTILAAYYQTLICVIQLLFLTYILISKVVYTFRNTKSYTFSS